MSYITLGDDDLAVRASAAIDSDDRIVLGRLLDALCRERAKPALGRTSVAPMPVPIKVRWSMGRVTLTVGTACSAFALLDRRREWRPIPLGRIEAGGRARDGTRGCGRWFRCADLVLHVQEERYLEGSSGETATVPPPDSDRGSGTVLVLRAVD
jgi:hypothetical protein